MISNLVTVMGDSVTDKISKASTDVYDSVKTIALAIGVPCAAIALAIWAFAPDQKVAATGKSWLGRILLGLFGILVVTSLIQFVQGLA